MRFVFVTAALCLSLTSPVLAEYLEVRRNSTLKADHSGSAAVRESVSAGTYLELLDPNINNRYYFARNPATGTEGWIYHQHVRRFEGDVPDAGVVTGVAPAQEFVDRHFRLGKPVFIHDRVREGYALAHDARLKIPAWVQYELRPQDLNGPADRSDDYRADTSIPFGQRAETADYSGSGLDQGHMAPAEDMNRSDRVMSDSFLLSNMAPQVGIGFNRHIWAQLEAAVRGWVEQRGAFDGHHRAGL